MGTVSLDKKTFPHDAPFDAGSAEPIDLGYKFKTWAQGPLVWWRMDPSAEDLQEVGRAQTYYDNFPKTFRFRTPETQEIADGALDIGTLSPDARERFLAMPSTDRHYSPDYEGDKAHNHIFYPRLWRKGDNVDPANDDRFLLCVPKGLAENVIPIVDAMSRYVYHSLPSERLWPYLRMSFRVLATTIDPGKNSNPVFSNWHTHASKGKIHKGIIAVSNGLTTRVAQKVEKIPTKEFNEASLPEGAVVETGKVQTKIVHGLKQSPAWTMTHFGDELEHDGSINTQEEVFDRRFLRNFYAVEGLTAALNDCPELSDIIGNSVSKASALVHKGPV